MKMWTGVIWLRIETRGGVLWTRYSGFMIHKRRGISWQHERLLVSQIGPSSTGIVGSQSLWKWFWKMDEKHLSRNWRRKKQKLELQTQRLGHNIRK
jgi:hypothetical protein